MSTVEQGGCACCGTAADSTEPAARTRFVAGAERLGITGTDLTDLVGVFDRGDCLATRARMAALVQVRLAAAQERSVALTGLAAARRVADDTERPPVPPDEIVTTLAMVASLQAAAARLAEPTGSGGCGEDCACVTAAAAHERPVTRLAMAAAALPGGSRPDLVCTFDGGPDAMRARISDWQAVVDRATAREPADGGVTLVYDQDPALTAELARLAAAEFACCSFFTFTLTVAPAGMRFTVTAPAEAGDVVTAMFGGR